MTIGSVMSLAEVRILTSQVGQIKGVWLRFEVN